MNEVDDVVLLRVLLKDVEPARANGTFDPRVQADDARAVAKKSEDIVAEVRRAEATPGSRHYFLSREAFALARFDLSEAEIQGVLLPAFVASAGEHRQREGERTIRDAVFARRVGK